MTKPRKLGPSMNTASQPAGVEIRFYRSNEKPYGAFSNLFRRSMVFEGRTYPTAEHAYQAGKAKKAAVREWILSAPSPALVAMAAHGLYTWDIVPQWSRIKFDRMRQVLRAKFSQHDDLRALLLSTGSARLVETGRADTPVNRLWGEVNGKGRNMLGIMLMELRDELRMAQQQPTNQSKRSPPQAAGLLGTKPIQTKTIERLLSSQGDAVGCICGSPPP